MITVKKSSPKESKTGSSTMPQYSAISKYSLVKGTPRVIKDWLGLLPQDFRVPLSRPQGNKKEKRTIGICGHKQLTVFAEYDLNTCCWRTSQVSLLTNTFSEYSGTWPKFFQILKGVAWEDSFLGIYPTAKEFGLSLLRPTAQCWRAWTFKNINPLIRKNHADGNLQEQSARCFHKMITPESNEILMMWPEGWSDLRPLEMDKWGLWLEQHGRY